MSMKDVFEVRLKKVHQTIDILFSQHKDLCRKADCMAVAINAMEETAADLKAKIEKENK